MTRSNRGANARAEAARGDDALRAAEALLGLDLPNDAVSRAYYAAFHYGRALLLSEGVGGAHLVAHATDVVTDTIQDGGD